MAKKRAATVARGAVIERYLVQRKIARALRIITLSGGGSFREGQRDALIQMRDWLKAQPARTKKPGGIGR